jgi:hypothetical protein
MKKDHLPCPNCDGSDSLSADEYVTYCFRCFLWTDVESGMKKYIDDEGKTAPYEGKINVVYYHSIQATE